MPMQYNANYTLAEEAKWKAMVSRECYDAKHRIE